MSQEPRFVVLEHRCGDIHHDFMLERGGILRTWAIDAAIQPGIVQPARALPDHRPIYLDYEGPISHDRGSVRRLVAGTYAVVCWDEGRVVVRLRGDQLSGEAELCRLAGESWTFFLPGKLD